MGNINKIWGERHRFFLNDKVEMDVLYLKKDSFCSTHRHKYKINKFKVLKGRVRIETDFGEVTLSTQWQEWTVPPPRVHRFFAEEDSIMLEIAYTEDRKIDPKDIERFSQGGMVINGEEIPHDEMKKRGLLKL